jgi:two-component system response regulator YesN
MYRLLLVDDEYLELEYLEQYVPWQDMGFELVATAQNGLEALEQIEAYNPDVLITDVRMPFMDGVELARRIRQTRKDIVIVFLSGYGQFDYLKAAIQVNASDYLLKPVDLQELQKVMASVKVKCEQEQGARNVQKSILAEKLKQALTEETPLIEESVNLFNQIYALDEKNRDCYFFFVSIDEYRYLLANRDMLDFSIQDLEAAILSAAQRVDAVAVQLEIASYVFLTPGSSKEVLSTWKKEEQDSQKFISVFFSDDKVRIQEIPSLTKDIRLLRNVYIRTVACGQMCSLSTLQAVKPESCAKMELDSDSLIRFLLKGEETEVKRWFSQYYNRAWKEMHTSSIALIDVVYASLPEIPMDSESKFSLYRRISDIESFEMLKTFVETHLLSIMHEIRSKEPNAISSTLKSIHQYIDEHYQEVFTIDTLSEIFNYSPNYIRYIFKKNSGCTVLEYTTNVRMQQAAKLLNETHMKIRAISEAVGYVNPSYFSTQFIRKFGISPQQYRLRGSK